MPSTLSPPVVTCPCARAPRWPRRPLRRSALSSPRSSARPNAAPAAVATLSAAAARADGAPTSAARQQTRGDGRTLEQADGLTAVVRARPARLASGRLPVEDAPHDRRDDAATAPAAAPSQEVRRHGAVPAVGVLRDRGGPAHRRQLDGRRQRGLAVAEPVVAVDAADPVGQRERHVDLPGHHVRAGHGGERRGQVAVGEDRVGQGALAARAVGEHRARGELLRRAEHGELRGEHRRRRARATASRRRPRARPGRPRRRSRRRASSRPR